MPAAPAATPPPSPTPAPAPAPAPTPAPAATTPSAPAPAPAPTEQTAIEKASAAIRGVLDSGKSKTPEKAPPAGPEPDELEKAIKSNPKAWKVFEGVKKSFATQKAELEAKIKALESKTAPTAADDTKLKAMEKRLADMEGETKTYRQRLAERDYRESEEFKTKFVDRWQATWKAAVAEVATFQILDDMGDPERNATDKDFELLRNSPPSVRRTKAKEMFGDSAPDVIGHIRELERIELEGNQAVENASKNYEKINAEKQAKQSESFKKFNELRSASQKEIETQFPEYFSPEHYKEEPEAQKILTDGYQWIDMIAEGNTQVPDDERAAIFAMVRARAAATPMLIHQLKAVRAEVDALKEELSKFRGSDPSAGGRRASPPATEDPIGGINKAAAVFDEM